MTPEALVDQAVKDKLGVLAITDHNPRCHVTHAQPHLDLGFAGGRGRPRNRSTERATSGTLR